MEILIKPTVKLNFCDKETFMVYSNLVKEEGDIMKKEIFEWTKSIVIAVVVGLVISHFAMVLCVYDVSMNPTLVEMDRLILVNKLSINPGDVVAFKTEIPLNDSELKKVNFIQKLRYGTTKNLIKRVVAVSGDSVHVEDGEVYVNDQQLDETYINEDYTVGYIDIEEIPEGFVFAMGDNRQHSLDSRNESVGLIKSKSIMGKVVLRVFPFGKLGTLAK